MHFLDNVQITTNKYFEIELIGRERLSFSYFTNDYTCLGHGQFYKNMDLNLSAGYSGIFLS